MQIQAGTNKKHDIYSSDIKILKTPKCIRYRTAKEHNEVGVVSVWFYLCIRKLII